MKKQSPRTHPDSGCASIVVELAPYCAGDLDAAQTGRIEAHLETCGDCRAELQRERHLRATLSGLPVVPCPQRVTDSILRQIQGRTAPADQATGRSRRNWLAVSGWVTAATVAALMVLGGLPRGEAPDGAPGGPEFTAQEVALARKQAAASLNLAAVILNHTERSTVQEVFGHTLPTSLTRSIKTLVTPPEGGQG